MSGTQESQQDNVTGDLTTGEGSGAKTEGEETNNTEQEDRPRGTEPDNAGTKPPNTNDGDETLPLLKQDPDGRPRNGQGEGGGGKEEGEISTDGGKNSQEGEGNVKEGENQAAGKEEENIQSPFGKTEDDNVSKNGTEPKKHVPTEDGDNAEQDTTDTELEKQIPAEPMEGKHKVQDTADTKPKERENTKPDTTDTESENRTPAERAGENTEQETAGKKSEKQTPTELESEQSEQDITDTESENQILTKPEEIECTEQDASSDKKSDKHTPTELEKETTEQDTTDTKPPVKGQTGSPMTPDAEPTAEDIEQTITPQTDDPVIGAETDHQGQNDEVLQDNGNRGNLPPNDSWNKEERDLEDREKELHEEINRQQELSDQERKRSLSETMKPVEDSHVEGDKEGEVFFDAKEKVDILFIENPDQQPLANVLKNCQRYKTELQLGQELEEAQKEYQNLLKRTKETQSLKEVSQMQKNEPPCELHFVNKDGRKEAPMLYGVISSVSEKCPRYNWGHAVREFITLTTYSKSEPQRAKNQQRPRSTSGYQTKTPKTYRNSIEKLLDQDWQSDFIPKSAVDYDYKRFFTSENVLRSSFPDAYIFNLANSTVSGPEDVPAEYRDRTLCAFLQTIDMKKLGVNPRDAWRDYGRCILAEKQLDLARRAVGPDLDKNVLINKQTYFKIQNELQEKTQEIEELSTRLSKFASQQLTEGNPNIADLSDTHRPTRLGEMYSQLFDDEWSEAFEAFKPKKEEDEDDDEDIFPDTLFVLQNMLREAFEFCKSQSQIQMTELEDGFATIIGLKEPKKIKKKEGKSLETQTDWEEKGEDEKMKGEGGGDSGEDRQGPDPSEDVEEMEKSTEQLTLSNEAVDEREARVEGRTLMTDDTGDNIQKDTSGSNDSNKGVSEKGEGKEETHGKSEPSDQITEKRDQENVDTQETPVPDPDPELQPTNNSANKSDNEGAEKTELEDKKEEVSEEGVPQNKHNEGTDEQVTEPRKEMDKEGESKVEKNETIDPDETEKKEELEEIPKNADTEPRKDMDKEDGTKVEVKETRDTDETEKKEDLAELPKNSNTADESGEKSHQQTGKDEASNPEDKREKPKVQKPDGEEERPNDGPDDITEVKEGLEQGPEVEEEIEDRTYRTDLSFPMIERHARDFRKAAAGTSAKTKSKLFIEAELPALVKDENIRADIRTLTYARKCVELCWYMCMQDPPMLIITPQKGEEVDKGLFSFHGRRGKTVEVCVWPALLLHDNGPLVCKGYVLPEERKRKK